MALNAHEAAGGHTIARHIGVAPMQLQHRLLAEGKFAVSSFWDRAVARASINYAVATNFQAVANWFFGGQSPRFDLSVPTPSRTSIGYGVLAAQAGLRFTRQVTVVLERVGATVRVVTAYPQL